MRSDEAREVDDEMPSLRKRDIYEGKFFYEVLRNKETGRLELVGPLTGIRHVRAKEGSSEHEYEYIQIVDGKPVQAFTKEEILVTNRKL